MLFSKFPLNILRLLIPAVLVLGACTEPNSSVAVETTVVQEEPDEERCVIGASGENTDCPPEDLVIEDSVGGAIERFTEEETRESDLQYLLLDEASYTQMLAPVFGEAELVPGARMPIYGFYVPALAEFTDPMTWQQEWRLASGPTIVEQVVLLPSDYSAANAFDLWKASALANGLFSADGAAATGFTTVYTDPANTRPNRTCAVQSIVAVSRLLVSVTLLTGGDCTTPSLLGATILDGLVKRIEATFSG